MTSANDEGLLARVVAALATVPGIRAVALGGSRARGTATAHSDYDIGLYYDPGTPLDLAALRRAVTSLDDAGPRAEVTAIGSWGPWINGGGWLTIAGRRVDLLYRDLARVQEVIDDCCAGRIAVVYQPGHPHAFVSAIYMGEVACCRVLSDPDGRLAGLVGRTAPYPAALGAALLQRFGWEAAFALANARKALDRGDVAYLAGCAFRAVACLCQALFALNGRYLINEKGAVAEADGFERRPPALRRRIEAAFRDLGAGDAAAALAALDALVADGEALARAS